MPRVAAVVLNHNGRDLLDVVLPSLLAQTLEADAVVVDDASTDGSVAHLAERYPDVRVVALRDNVGVTAAMNRGLAATDADVVALLNNDLELDPRFLERAVAALEADPKAGSVSARMLRFDARDRIDAAGDQLLPSGAAVNRGAGRPDGPPFDVSAEVFSACGGAAVYRRAALDAVGPFDESLVAYLEDVDWGFRARLQGWHATYAPDAIAFHMGGATTGRRRGHFGTLQRRNHLVVMVKDDPRIVRRLPLVLAYQAAWFAASVRDGLAREHLRAWVAFARMLPAVLRARRAVQATRTAPVAEVERALRLGLPRGRAKRLAVQLAPQAARRWLP